MYRAKGGDEGAQAGIHGSAGAGLALFELLVGVGGDASGVGQGFLAQALGDAGALQPQAQTRPGQIIQQLGRGHTRHVLAVKAEGFDDGIAQSRCFLTNRLPEAGQRMRLLVAPEGVLEEGRQHPSTKEDATQLTQCQRLQPTPVTQPQWRQPGVEHHEENASQGEGDG